MDTFFVALLGFALIWLLIRLVFRFFIFSVGIGIALFLVFYQAKDISPERQISEYDRDVIQDQKPAIALETTATEAPPQDAHQTGASGTEDPLPEPPVPSPSSIPTRPIPPTQRTPQVLSLPSGARLHPGCMGYRRLLPAGTPILSARTDESSSFRDPVEFEWLLWQRNIDPAQVSETGLVCVFNEGQFVVHEYEYQGSRSAVRYEKIKPVGSG
jgi:hypothetical protein